MTACEGDAIIASANEGREGSGANPVSQEWELQLKKNGRRRAWALRVIAAQQVRGHSHRMSRAVLIGHHCIVWE